MTPEPTSKCIFCGEPCFVIQVPAPIPVSDAYCPDCWKACAEFYGACQLPIYNGPPGVIELEDEDCETVVVE